MSQVIQLRRDTAANWSSVNPVLAQGEVGFDLTNNQIRVGDGSTAWNSLSVYGVAGGNAVTAVASAAGVLTINCALGDYFTVALSENITSIVFTGLPGSGIGASKVIRFTQGAGPYTVAWPASFKWAGATPGAVSVGSGDVDILGLTSFDQGTTWQATLSNAFA